jgi:EmrB/QacA subfamily drug resistance transporter
MNSQDLNQPSTNGTDLSKTCCSDPRLLEEVGDLNPDLSTSEEVQSDEQKNQPSSSGKWWAMLGIGMGVFMFSLDVFIVNIALPTLVRDLHVSFTSIQWVRLIYPLMLSVLVLSAARLGDMWSKKWLYLSGLILFTISSLLCGLASTVSFLIAFRAMQGLGAVFMSALARAIIIQVFPSQERGKALGIIGSIALLGVSIGPTVGGLLIGLWSWHAIFLVNVPIGLIASVVIALVVPSGVTPQAKQSFDWLGALLISVTLSCFALAMTSLQSQAKGSQTGLIMLALAVVGLGCFLAVESRLESPMLDLQIFRSVKFSSSLLLSAMVSLVRAGITLLIPFFLELVKHYSAFEVGLLMAVGPISAGLMAPIAGTLSDRFGTRIVSLTGLVLMVCGCLTMSTFDRELTVGGYIVRILPLALGTGIFQSPNQSAIMGAAPQERLGIASGLLSLSQNLGQTIGLALMGTLFSLLTRSHTQAPSEMDVTKAPIEALVFGVQMSFRLVAPILMAATILAAFLWWLEQRKELPDEEVLPSD